MKIYTENGIRIIEADDGAFVTNGATYSDKVYLGKNAPESAWRDATAEEKAEWDISQNDPSVDEQAEVTDYENALSDLGVRFND